VRHECAVLVLGSGDPAEAARGSRARRAIERGDRARVDLYSDFMATQNAIRSFRAFTRGRVVLGFGARATAHG